MQLTALELLAPARNVEIGIAAIDCGADAVYIAGPAFGARAAAGNPVEDIARLCRYAHLYGAKVHATVNTLLEDEEVASALDLMQQLYEAGVDVFIVQDLRLLEHPLPPAELHASTQTAIRTPERAVELSSMGFSSLVLERQLTLQQVKEIRAAVPESCSLEFFIHGALCVGYSGQCYLSQHLAGRSANRGVCAQVCRSRYDLVDASGRVLVRDRALLSPRDLRFDGHLADLVEAGATSFKIEGRLKNASYVKNVVRHYRSVIDSFIASHPDYCRSSSGRLEGGFTPDPDSTFTRGWTDALLEGRKGKMASVDAAKAMGQYVGEIVSVRGRDIVLKGGVQLSNGDGLSFVGRDAEVTGRRVEVASGDRVQLRDSSGLSAGMKVYRNYDIRFERELEKNMPRRVIDVSVSWTSEEGRTRVAATAQGVSVEKEFVDDAPLAGKPESALENLRRQMGKNTGPFAFVLDKIEVDQVRFYQASFVNGIRRDMAAELQEKLEARRSAPMEHAPVPGARTHNHSTLSLPDELLRSRYCIKWEMDLCPKQRKNTSAGVPREPLYLVNQGNRLRLEFDCAHCEMVVLAK